MNIAEKGVQAFRDDKFVPNNKLVKDRASYLQFQDVINKQYVESVRKGNGMLIQTKVLEVIAETCVEEGLHVGLNWCQIHHMPKDGSIRVLADCSNTDDDSLPLNSEASKLAAQNEYGEIVHPTLSSILGGISGEAVKEGWDNLVLWKVDVAGAFTLMDMHPEDVPLLAFKLSNGLPTAGVFGLSSMPFGFEVGTEVVRESMRLTMRGFTDVYVDDSMGATGRDFVQQEIKKAGDAITAIYGPGTVAEHKTEFGRQLVLLGWLIDCDSRTVTMSEKNALKAMSIVLGADLEGLVAIGWIRKVASLLSRYAVIHPEMKPYVGHLYDHLAGVSGGGYSRSGDLVRVRLFVEAKHCLRRWRAFLCLQELGGEKYRRPIAELVPNLTSASWLIDYDASLY